MEYTLYGILIILALFVILMVFNPKLSCFGKKLKSPFYPVMRKKMLKREKRQTLDYGFDLGGTGENRARGAGKPKQDSERSPRKGTNIATEYGFDLGGKSQKKQG
jgi:hypothetical protein